MSAPGVSLERLREAGFDDDAIRRVSDKLPSAFDIRFAFNVETLGADFCRETLGIDSTRIEAGKLDILTELGFTQQEIEAANLHACGAMTLSRVHPGSRKVISPSSIAPRHADGWERGPSVSRVTSA